MSPDLEPLAAGLAAAEGITFEAAAGAISAAQAVTMDADAAPAGVVFAVDPDKRIIRGMAVPFEVEGVKNGRRWMFHKGTVRNRDGARAKLWALHDKAQAVGVEIPAETFEDDTGRFYAFKIANTPAGDHALAMADPDSGPWDSLSIGPHETAKFQLRDGVYHSVDVPLTEVSLTPAAVFTAARVSSVAFDETPNPERHIMTESTTLETPAPVALPETFAADLSTLLTPGVAEAIANGFGALGDLGGPQVVQAGTVEVTEPSPYRFDGTEGAESFSEDLRSYNSDPEARQRLETFMEDVWSEQFAVTSANTATLNPTRNRPDLFVPNLTFTRPLWDLVTTGGLDDKTPFTIPKFASAAGLVGAHTEGVEPTPGSFTATSQTITPGAVSGKVEIVREVWDQGGSPQADQIIWGEMLNGYFEALEAKIAATLNALALTEINLASAVDSALVDAVTNIFVDLQFVRGGNRYSALALDGLLFKALINAKDTTGRKLLPVVGPMNAQGGTNGNFSRVQVGSQEGAAAWALGSTNTSNSYLFVPSSVYAWASPPKRFVFEYRVSAIDLAIWGYSATGVTRDTDVKRIDYTTADV